ncbi:putative sulfate permease [Klebsiella pneumoniae]|uniref:Putative sulfate permease n=1 Tax=Klebsiella pneumoniae TaxID=573 RepID=A0A377TIU8_KLEPN|nr:putative sulfate permease [Klebsiella pneumoniae]
MAASPHSLRALSCFVWWFFLRDWVSQIPMAALVAVMIMVSIGTFSWGSIANLRSHPLSTSVVMLATVVVVVATHNLAVWRLNRRSDCLIELCHQSGPFYGGVVRT